MNLKNVCIITNDIRTHLPPVTSDRINMLTQVWIIAVASVQLPFNVIAVKSVRSHFYACITESIFHNKQGKLSEQNGNLNCTSPSHLYYFYNL